ncbi:MAG: DNA primase catalytic subunit PriS [Methanocellales archaeon]|nr:DNA primase catalytic subunit PriS [Methanocellales archaeon]
MNERTKEFIQDRFREYYQSASIRLPPRFEQREWGFIFFDESYPDIVMRRHKSFMTAWEAIDYIRSMVPAHAFHSAAYYMYPGAPTMKEKGWRGADLIFDLDADHLQIKWTTYGDMLQRTKEETLKLIDFLRADFALAEDDIEIVFSGGRGYHIHVREPRMIELESPERREIVDYLTGLTLEMDRIFGEKIVGGDFGHAKVVRIPSQESKGWGGRINSWIVSFLLDVGRKDEDEAIKILKSFEGIGDERALEILKMVKNKSHLASVRKGNLSASRRIPISFWRELVKRAIADVGAKPDEPVTADVKRLIRLPTSLHGGSGFRVTPLTLGELETFDPLSDAIVFGDDMIRVNVTKASDVEIKDERHVIKKGKQDLPEHLAIFLMCRGMAEYEP